ncbi:MAG: hypothetical protein F6K35_26800 [Okeania sp. SIO2H7]|nr:hypothetical protein [Okeania sp. SIO2H7]
MPLKCTGDNLPQDIPIIKVEETPNCFDDFCQIVNSGDEVLLHQAIEKNRGYYYWFILEADDLPLAVCELEKYADYAAEKEQWLGRRADYLIIGYYEGDCYLIVVELRHVLVKEKQEDDKFKQLLESIEQILKCLPIISNSQTLEKVYSSPDDYKIIGAIVAPGNTRSFNRRELNPIRSVNSHKVLIRTLPKDALSNCKITWTDFIQRMGLPPNRSEFNISKT